MSGQIRVEQTEAALRLVIDRAKQANALTPELAVGLREGLARAAADPTVRAVLLTGAGDRVFCGGFDLGRVGRSAPTDDQTGLASLMEAVRSCPVPVIALLNGHAIGAGFELACACDLLLARVGARIGLPAVRLGVAYRLEGLAAVLGASPAAKRLLLTGEQIEIEQVPGLADVIVAPAQLETTAETWVQAIASSAPAALTYTLQAMRSLSCWTVGEQERKRLDALRRQIMAGGDVGEAVNARREGRPPRFRPRDVDSSSERSAEWD
jgi:enoyl-CoA hydratase/carnithine racemase